MDGFGIPGTLTATFTYNAGTTFAYTTTFTPGEVLTATLPVAANVLTGEVDIVAPRYFFNSTD